MLNHKRKNQRGFTIIELLLVMSIMSLLSSVIFVTVKKTKLLARDGRRAVDMHQIKTALLLYYSDHGKFPCNDGTGSYYDTDFLKPLVDGNYIAKIPKHPINTAAYEYD